MLKVNNAYRQLCVTKLRNQTWPSVLMHEHFAELFGTAVLLFAVRCWKGFEVSEK